jgi:hypothetical protein
MYDTYVPQQVDGSSCGYITGRNMELACLELHPDSENSGCWGGEWPRDAATRLRLSMYAHLYPRCPAPTPVDAKSAATAGRKRRADALTVPVAVGTIPLFKPCVWVLTGAPAPKDSSRTSVTAACTRNGVGQRKPMNVL